MFTVTQGVYLITYW